MHDLWKQTVEILRLEMSPLNFDTWIAPIKFQGGSHETGQINIEVPNIFFREWIVDNYLGQINRLLKQQSGRDFNFNFSFSGTEEIEDSPDIPEPGKPRDRQQKYTPKTGTMNPRYTFDNFVVGSCNEFAHAACLAVAQKRPESYNPLFIYGGVGLGKTHLLCAVGHFIAANNKNARISYLSSEEFMNELILALRHEKMESFRNSYRNSCDVLLIDDIQFLAGKERTQEEFFHTFNALYKAGRQIAITCDRFPREMSELDERLRSRFAWGLIADIQPPDIETKVAILRKKSDSEKIALPDDVAMYLAANTNFNIREMEGALIRLGAFASLLNRKIDLEFAQEILKDVLDSSGAGLTIESIQRAVANHYGVKISDLKSSKRTKTLSQPRQLAMYLCRQLTSFSFPQIGEKFGNRDHSTVVYAVKKVDQEVKSGVGEFADAAAKIKRSLGK